MKTNGYLLMLMALTWLALMPSSISQAQKREILKNPTISSTSLIEKNPADLISNHIIQSNQIRNAFNSPSNPVEFHTDSIIYYSGTNLNFRETFVHDTRGRLISYLKETKDAFGWVNSEMETFTYDNEDHVLTEMKQSWVNFFWEKTYLLTYTYDEAGNMLTYLIQKREYNHWANYNLLSYSYNFNGNLTSCLEQYWGIEEWVNSTLTLNHFDDRGNLDLSERQVWTGADWEFTSRNLNTYDLSGNVLTTTVQYWTDFNWISSELYTYTYDENGKLAIKLMQYYYDDNWINMILNVCTYDTEGHQLTCCELFWLNEDWVNHSLVSRTFDDDGNMLSELSQEWDNTWNNIASSVYTYDEKGNCMSTTWSFWSTSKWENSSMVEYEYNDGMIRGTGYFWDGAAWISGDALIDLIYRNEDSQKLLCEWYGSRAEVYYSELYTGTPELQNNKEVSVNVYPNPAKDFLMVDIANAANDPATVSVYDLSGKMVQSFTDTGLTGGNPIILDVSHCGTGLYMIGIQSGNHELVKKFSIIR